MDCPFKPLTSIEWMPRMRLAQVIEIEKHISTSSCYHPPLKDLVFHGAIDGISPLLLGCYHGSLEAVKRIVECWGVNVKATAVYYIPLCSNTAQPTAFCADDCEDEYECDTSWIKIEGVSPLFVAAQRGNFYVVQYLLEKGADLLVKTSCSTRIRYDGLTPLHGALLDCRLLNKFDANPDTACLLLEAGADPSVLPTDQTPIWMSIRGIKAITALINHGLDLTQRDPDSSMTILHQWASRLEYVTEEQSLSIVKLLVEKGADLLARDRHGFTPILTAAVHGTLNFSVLDYLLERPEIPRIDKIDAAELAGSVILGTFRSPQYHQRHLKAFEYWRKALLFRRMNEPVDKVLLNFKNVKTAEWVTHEQLEEVIQNPSTYWINSIFVQLRFIIARKTWEAFNSFQYSEKLPDNQFPDPNQIYDFLDIFWSKLEFFCFISKGGIDTLHPTRKFQNWMLKASRFLIYILVDIQRRFPFLLTVEIMKTSLELISDTDASFMTDCLGITTVNRMRNLLQLIELLALLPHMLNETGREKTKVESSPETIIKESLKDLVKRERRDKKGRTFLHIACRSDLLHESPDRFLAVIRLLVDFGADPNAVDADRNGPLHFLAKLNGEMVDAAADLLLEKGAHFDRIKKSGKTAADVWTERNEGDNEWCDRPSWMRDSVPLPLECQCARVIRDNQVPYIKLLPESLCHFVKMHK